MLFEIPPGGHWECRTRTQEIKGLVVLARRPDLFHVEVIFAELVASLGKVIEQVTSLLNILSRAGLDAHLQGLFQLLVVEIEKLRLV